MIRLNSAKSNLTSLFGVILVVVSLSSLSCTEKDSTSSKVGESSKQSATAGAVMSAEQLKERGKAVYASSCIACHNVDPAKDGAIGPAVSGSSLELISARVIKGNYPEGYTPKRQTRTMVALPHLEKEVSALFEYLK